jgi:oligopeptide transport system substrate-binding protein
MDGLVGLDLQGKVEPRLASHYVVSPDGKRYTFTLRPEALWSDGRPVLPKDFVLGFQRVLDPAANSSWAQFLFPIRGARAFHEKKGGFEQVGVRSEGENQLVIELEKPSPTFLSVLSLPVAYPARAEWAATPIWNDKTPVTGPYQVAFQKVKESILLAPNEHYWGRRVLGKMIARPVMLRIVSDPAEANALFSSGLLDVLVQESQTPEQKNTRAEIDPMAPFRVKSALTLSARVGKAPVDSLGLIRFEDIEIK